MYALAGQVQLFIYVYSCGLARDCNLTNGANIRHISALRVRQRVARGVLVAFRYLCYIYI